DAPRDRVVVGDAEDQRLLALEQAHDNLQRIETGRFWSTGVGAEHEARAGLHGFEASATRCDHTIGSMASDLRTALDGVRAFVLDADGVLLYRGQPIAGSPEALTELRRRRIPYRVVTNFSSAHRSSLAAAFRN